MRSLLERPISFRLSNAAYRRYESAAADRGMTLSAYLRDRLEVDDQVAEHVAQLRLTLMDAGPSSGEAAPMLTKVSQFLSRAGVIKSADGAANTIVVTDTTDAQDRIGEFLDAENRQMTRRVRLVFEEITVQRDRLNQGSVDWKILLNSLRRENTASAIGVGPLLDAAKAAGCVGASVGSGPFAGTNIALSALSQLGSIINHKSIPLLSLNRRADRYPWPDPPGRTRGGGASLAQQSRRG